MKLLLLGFGEINKLMKALIISSVLRGEGWGGHQDSSVLGMKGQGGLTHLEVCGWNLGFEGRQRLGEKADDVRGRGC